MDGIDEGHEDQLRVHQDGRVYPLGRALRSTYDAENHDSLGSDVAGLMIDLSHIPYEPFERLPEPQMAATPPPRSWLGRIGGLFGHR